jgi:hypothetical protein
MMMAGTTSPPRASGTELRRWVIGDAVGPAVGDRFRRVDELIGKSLVALHLDLDDPTV